MRHPFTKLDVITIFTASIVLRVCIPGSIMYLVSCMTFGLCYGTLKAYLGD